MNTKWALVNDQDDTCTVNENPPWCEIGESSSFLLSRLLSFGYCNSDGTWHSPVHSRMTEQSSSKCHQVLTEASDSSVELITEYSLRSRMLEVRLQAVGDDRPKWVSFVMSARKDEHFYGLGERFDSLDQRGKTVDLYVVNGAQCGRTYKPIPFYISSSGYGLSLDTTARTMIRFNVPDEPGRVEVRVADSCVTARFFLDGTPAAVLTHYTETVGRPAVPPAWVFGPWKSRDWRTETERTVLEDVTLGRTHRLAGTVKVIDAAWETDNNSFVFDPAKFPKAREMIERIHALGYRLILWISPWMAKGETPSEVYRFCAEHGYLIRNPGGEVYVHRLGNSPNFFGSCIDFTNPEAVDWWKQQIQRLIELGVDGFKTDFGEQVPDDAQFADGRDGRALHNLYPYLYNSITYDTVRETKDGVTLARSTWAGSQKLSLIWAGDQTSDFAPASGLPSAIIAGQSAGLSGFPFWACDIGGYFGRPTEEAFIRWVEFAAFCPIMQIHGMGPREPWSFSPTVLAIYRRYAQEHLDLSPLFLALAHEAHTTGLPVMRALFLAFPNDPRIHNETAEHEYLLGDSLLVCPMYSEGDRRTVVYLPEGTWRSFWTGELFQGGDLYTVPVGLDEISVFARVGAIIPRLDGSPETLLPVSEPTIRVATQDLRLDIFPGADGELQLQDGTRFIWHDSTGLLNVSNPAVRRKLSVRLRGLSAKRVETSPPQETQERTTGDGAAYTEILLSEGATQQLTIVAE